MLVENQVMYKIDMRPKIRSTLVYDFWPTTLLTILFMTTYVSENLLLIIFFIIQGQVRVKQFRGGALRLGQEMSIISVSCILAPCTKLIEGGRGAGGGQKVVIRIQPKNRLLGIVQCHIEINLTILWYIDCSFCCVL